MCVYIQTTDGLKVEQDLQKSICSYFRTQQFVKEKVRNMSFAIVNRVIIGNIIYSENILRVS